MAKQEFHIDYFDKKYLDFHHPDRENVPTFQLSAGDPPSPYAHSYVISKPNNFPILILDVLQYLKKPTSLDDTYQPEFSKETLAQIGETGKEILEEICNLHNDFVTPKRT